MQGFDGLLAPSGTDLTVGFRYINRSTDRPLVVEICGLAAGQSVPLFFAGGGCGASGNGATTIASYNVPVNSQWATFGPNQFTVPGNFTAIVLSIKAGGNVSQNLAIGVDDVFLGIPNQDPVCDAAEASPSSIWPPNHELVPIEILGVTDPDGDPVTIAVDSIRQDEPVNDRGDGNTTPDATGVGTDQPSVRAERSGRGNGRVYTIAFTASDDQGGSCTSSVTVSVPKSQNGKPAVDDGPTYDSTNP